MPEEKFSLTWRSDAPVLMQRVAGFWSREDGRRWVEAAIRATDDRPADAWYMISDVRDYLAQKDELSEFRDEAASYEFAHGLVRMIIIHSGGVAQMQRRRIHDALPYGDRFDYVTTTGAAEARLAELLGVPQPQ